MKKADALCRRSDASLPRRPPRSPQEAVRQTAREYTARQKLDVQLARMRVTLKLQKDREAYHRETTKVLSLVRQKNEAARRGDVKRFGRLDEQEQLALQRREAVARRLGFKVCGRRLATAK